MSPGLSLLPLGGAMPRTSGPPTPMIWKLSSTPLRAEERLGLGDQLVVGAARPRRVAEHRIALVGDLAGAADGVDLRWHLAHQQPVEKRRAVAEIEVLGAGRDLARDEPRRRSANAAVVEAVERLVDAVKQVGRMHDRDAVAFKLRAVGLERAVEVERDAVLADDGDRLPFQDAEVGGVAQIIVLPGVAVEDEHVGAFLRHLLQQPRLAIAVDAHGASVIPSSARTALRPCAPARS